MATFPFFRSFPHRVILLLRNKTSQRNKLIFIQVCRGEKARGTIGAEEAEGRATDERRGGEAERAARSSGRGGGWGRCLTTARLDTKLHEHKLVCYNRNYSSVDVYVLLLCLSKLEFEQAHMVVFQHRKIKIRKIHIKVFCTTIWSLFWKKLKSWIWKEISKFQL